MERHVPVVIALGSNLGNKRYHLARALAELQDLLHLVRVSSFHETDPVDAPAGSPRFLNAVAIGYTSLEPEELLRSLLAVEQRHGRRRRAVRNEPRSIDLDLILYGAQRLRTRALTLPHPRAAARTFVTEPLREIAPAYCEWLKKTGRGTASRASS